MSTPPPIVWSISGTDSGGGAGLSADQRAADAADVHLCPVVAAVTAQHSQAVLRIDAMPVDLLEAQLAALERDLPPQAVKTGLLGSAANVRAVVRCIDRLRRRGPVPLVVDPVLRASTGATFADAATLAAYRDHLLPRASVVTPNRREALLLTGQPAPASTAASAVMLTMRRTLATGSRMCTGFAAPSRMGPTVMPLLAAIFRRL